MTPRALRSALAVDSQYAPFTRCLVDNRALDVAAPRLARLVRKTRLSGPGEMVRWLSEGRQRRIVRRRIGRRSSSSTARPAVSAPALHDAPHPAIA